MGIGKRMTLCVIAVLLCLLSSCSVYHKIYKNGLPEKGVWYCEALDMQISFEDEPLGFVIIEGNKQEIAINYDRGSEVFSASFLNEIYQCFDTGKIFFTCECDYWDEDKMLVTEWLAEKGTKKGNSYLFIRVDKE